MNSPSDAVRIKEITIENAACFERITIPFNPDGVTVLVGENGTGKTTTLNAIVGVIISLTLLSILRKKDNNKEQISGTFNNIDMY